MEPASSWLLVGFITAEPRQELPETLLLILLHKDSGVSKTLNIRVMYLQEQLRVMGSGGL